MISALVRESLPDLPEARDRYEQRLFRERVLITTPGPTIAPYDLVFEAVHWHFTYTGNGRLHHKGVLGSAGFFWAWDEE